MASRWRRRIDDRRSTIVTSQLPVSHWHEALGEPTIADVILDRLVHNAYRIELGYVPWTRVSPSHRAPIC